MRILFYSFILIILTLFAFTFISPQGYVSPSIDQGNFLYIASQVLHHAIPYRDMWDNKPPGIYYIDAIGLWIGHGSVWGIWGIEVVSALISILLCFFTCKKFFSSFISFLIALTFLFLLMFFLSLEGGNFTEEFIIPLQFFALFWTFCKKNHSLSSVFLLGVLAGVSFLIKQNYIGLFVILIFFLLYQQKKSREKVQGLLLSGVGFLIPISSICLYFYSQHALGSFWTDAFVYNKIYSIVSFSQYLNAIVQDGIFFLKFNTFFIVAFVTWGITVWLLYTKKISFKKNPLLTVALIDFPVEFLSANLSARLYFHYYIPLLPSISILSGYFYSFLLERKKISIAHRSFSFHPLFKLIFFTQIIMLILIIPSIVLCSYIKFNHITSLERYHFLARVQQNLSSTDSIVEWGGRGGVYFSTHTVSLTPYASLFPLFTRNFQTKEMVDTLYTRIQQKHPKLIVDTAALDSWVTPIEGGVIDSKQWYGNGIYGEPRDMPKIIAYIQKHYHVLFTDKTLRSTVYEWKG